MAYRAIARCCILLILIAILPIDLYPNNTSHRSGYTDPTPASFYRTIIDANIFRPLGYTPPVSRPQYQLLGTSIATDDTFRHAFIIERISGRFHILSVGEKIGETTVISITEKQVILQREDKTEIRLSCGQLRFY